VLAGLAPPRTWSAPVAMGDVVRGALGEVEGYQRVRLRHVDESRVDGTAAADVSHVIAELVENALSFSPPEADVEVYGRRDDHGYVITIVDSGIGMHEEELERANTLISSVSALTLAPSRFLGHYVVAQLASRHGLSVHLAASPAGGLTAMIWLPAVLLGITNAPVAPAPAAAEPVAPNAEAERPAAGLPRRGAVTDAPPVDDRDATAAIAFRAAPAPPPLPPELSPDHPRELQLDDLAVDAAEAFNAIDHFDEIDAREAFDIVDRAVADAPVDAPVEVHDVIEPDAPSAAPEPAPAPEAPARPRVGLGSFADLRGAAVPPVRPAEEIAPTPEPAAAPAAAAPPVADPDRPAMIAPDRRASFAEVAQAVDVAAGRPPSDEPASSFSEDLLPQRLPKRGGRRNSKLETPWVRERPTVSAPPVVPSAGPAPAAAPVGAAPASALPSRNGSADSQVASAPAPVANGAGVQEPDSSTASADGGERFAFFAAFRAAAEQAREEAGIDDRRGH